MPIPNSSGNDEWGTPPEVLAWVTSRYGRIDLDLAARNQQRAVVPLYVGPGRALRPGMPERRFSLVPRPPSNDWTDGLRWDPELGAAEPGGHVWCNPPYSREAGGLESWCRKMYEVSLAGHRVTGLFFARTETRAWHEYVSKASEVWFIRGRLKFIDLETGKPAGTATAPSVLVHWSKPGEDDAVLASLLGPTYRNLDLKAWRAAMHVEEKERELDTWMPTIDRWVNGGEE